MTMQQLMGMMQGLQEAMAASKVEQERMQADLTASQARNEELHRTILTGNPRDSNPQDVHGTQSNLHRDGGS